MLMDGDRFVHVLQAHKVKCLYDLHRTRRPGGYSEGPTPVPIPNTAVKTLCANGTMS
jgi:hypothetical protein